MNVAIGQRLAPLGHGCGLITLWADLFDEKALRRPSGLNAGLLTVTGPEQVGMGSENVAALRPCRLMTALTVCLQDRPNVTKVTDGFRPRPFLLLAGTQPCHDKETHRV